MAVDPTQVAPASHEPGVPLEKPAYGLCILVMLLHIVDGMDMQLLGVTVNALARDWALPLSSFSTAMAAGHAGSAVGATLGGLLGDRLGRKPVIIGGVLLFGLASLAMAFAEAPQQLALLRFIAGIGLGGCLPPALALLTENMPGRYRGLAISLVMLSFPLGMALAGFLAMIVIPTQGWSAMFLLGGAVPLALAVLLFVGLAESPNRTAVPARDATKGRGTLARLFAGEERGKLLPLLGIFFCCYFATHMSLSWLAGLMAHIGASAQTASGAVSVWSLAGMPGVLVAGLVMTRWGIRRAVGVFIALGAAAFALLIAAVSSGASDGLPLLALLAFGGFALSGAITTIFAYCTDIFPSEVRSSAIGMSATAGRVGAIVGAAAGASLLELGGAPAFFGAAAGMLCIALLLYTVVVAKFRQQAVA